MNSKTLQKKLTPLMQQYWDVKAAHPDKIILFRMGDFYEMFHRDAEIAAPVLGIALTSRNKKAQDETPMCGVPHHAATNVINKLLGSGFKVAICDQLEDPKFAKGLVKRGITRTLSPGMVYDPETLDASKANYLASWDETGALAFFDVSTGEGFFFRSVPAARRFEFVESLKAVEWVLSPELASQESVRAQAERVGATLTAHAQKGWISADDVEVSPEKLGVAHEITVSWQAAPEAVRRLLAYSVGQFSEMQGAASAWVKTLRPFEERTLEGRMVLSASTLRHLEVFETYRGDRQGSLLGAIDRTKTSGGARLLRSWLQFPLVDRTQIEARLDRVQTWSEKDAARKGLRAALSGVGDLPRRLGKINQPSRGPRDLRSLADSLDAGLKAWFEASEVDKGLRADTIETDRIQEVIREIERVISDEPPVYVRQGGAIRVGANPVLDELITLSTDSSRLVLELEAREKELTGISSLKIRYNNVFGYSIEITNTHKDRVPLDRYDRRQTLANAERYTTKELSELETKVLSAQEKRLKLEEEEFAKLVQYVLSNAQALMRFALSLAELDVVSALGALAMEYRYIRPEFREADASVAVNLEGSRHPVVEQALEKPFVANDLTLDEGGCLLLTGPNMAGKSTLMRQIAVSVIMAQMGSIVPAARAEISILDRVATRIGASDFLSEGLSTFMVEMKETAELLAQAGDRTLVVLDEIGRGTSTFDGLSIAQAILEYLLAEKRCLTLFATHYHELTKLREKYDRIQNAHMAIHEQDGVITFLHRLMEGAAGRSYGIHVARLAGLPESVTVRAEQILTEVEGSIGSKTVRVETPQVSSSQVSSQASPQMSLLFHPAAAPVLSPKEVAAAKIADRVLKEIRTFDVNRSTPLEALGKISEWVQELH
ncbi:MAG: DNA mismatch repair protein MutS [Bdellovibrionales bacterium]|nr:DNA mismatch repair protein MutS [Bdellovibrionales bacterium]